MILKDDFTRYAWVDLLERKFDAADAFRNLLADVRRDDVPSEVERVRSDNGGEFFGGEFGDVCRQYCVNQEFINAKESGAKRRCRESSGYHPERGTCRAHPSPYPLLSRRIATVGDPLGRGSTLGVRSREPHCDHVQPGKQVAVRDVAW